MTKKIVLATVPSDSTPNLKYEIRLGHDDRIYCTCPRWRFSKTCKHLDRFKARVAA